jgi:acetyl-CoA hydrolase/transferase-like protein
VSGVGGQYNFVAQAFALAGARSILTLEASRKARGRDESNVRWSYGHLTIPRHLRDVIITEYGIADLRGKPDHDVIAAMLGVADSRFQAELMRQAKDAGKLARDFEIPGSARENFPERVNSALKPYRQRGLLPAFPFGSDFSEVEQRLIPALEVLKGASASALSVAQLAIAGLGADKPRFAAELARLGLDKPASWSDRLYRLLVSGALQRTG